jgi:septal ring factor EnvC (AmiA/AmiB activator)
MLVCEICALKTEVKILKQQVNTLQEELNIAHYANETLSNQFHQIREHNQKQGKQIQSLQMQVNTLTEQARRYEVAILDALSIAEMEKRDMLMEPWAGLEESIKESPREEQTK